LERRALGIPGQAEQPRQHPDDVAVDRGLVTAERDARDSTGGVWADPRQPPQLLELIGKPPRVQSDNLSSGALQVSRA
jgi:hypothetical protein